MTAPVPAERIEQKILVVRGHKVMVDRDLAYLYGVATKALNRAVKRNLDRFPEDFMFQLTSQEVKDLRFHPGTSSLRSQFGTSRDWAPRALSRGAGSTAARPPCGGTWWPSRTLPANYAVSSGLSPKFGTA